MGSLTAQVAALESWAWMEGSKKSSDTQEGLFLNFQSR